jgi:catechol 2,3-dioxygenase
MGSTTRDIFGDATGAAPATPGTYGEPPRSYRLPESTRLGAVKLQVADVARSTAYYENTLGLRVVRRERGQVVLAANEDDAPLVVLEEYAGARPAPRRGRLGLYHFAILLPDRPSLGRFMRHLGEIGARAGAADHLVSEAFYLQDPDNLGIEVYADRPRDTWRRVGRELMMATDPIDAAGLTQAAGDERWRGMPAGTTIGHVHLHVGDIDAGSAFFSNALGFDRMVWQYPGALFLGAGGYHHHLGTNTWAGAAATAAAADEARLLEWTIQLPNAASVAEAAESIERAGYSVERDANERAAEIVTRDPWGTPIRLITTEAVAPQR